MKHVPFRSLSLLQLGQRTHLVEEHPRERRASPTSSLIVMSSPSCRPRTLKGKEKGEGREGGEGLTASHRAA